MTAAVQYRSIRRNPWWIPPFMGGVREGISPAHLRVLGLQTERGWTPASFAGFSIVFGVFAIVGNLIALPWTLMVFLAMASGVCVRALATEIFPTAYRGTGAGTLVLLETVGVSAGLFLYTALAGLLDSQVLAISCVALACFGAAASMFLVPETARRELEEVS